MQNALITPNIANANITITPAAYAARRDALDTLTTPALRKERKSIEREAARADRQGSGEDAYALQCLLEWADDLLEGRKDSYTGQYDS